MQLSLSVLFCFPVYLFVRISCVCLLVVVVVVVVVVVFCKFGYHFDRLFIMLVLASLFVWCTFVVSSSNCFGKL